MNLALLKKKNLFYFHAVIIKNTKVKLKNQFHLQYYQKVKYSGTKLARQIQDLYMEATKYVS